MEKNNQKSNEIYSKLKEEITYMDVLPGSVLSEIENTKRFNISRTPVREAFKRLEFDGLLEVRPHIGTFVTLIDLDHIEDVMYLREKVELACMYHLCGQMTQKQKIKMEFILAKQEKLISSDISGHQLAREFILSDNDFHRSFFEYSTRLKIWEYLNNLEYDYQRFRVFLNIDEREVLKKLHDEHTQIFELIVTGDKDKLSEVYHDHLSKGFAEGLKKVFKAPQLFKSLSNIQ